MDFTIQYPRDTLSFRQAYGLWRAYFITTGDYNLSVCSMRDADGEGIPSNSHERRMVTQFSSTVRGEIYNESSLLKISMPVMNAARTEVAKKSLKVLRAELEQEIHNG